MNESHQLTAWGQALEKALSTLDPSEKLEEACFVAVELLRLGILGSKNWFTNISGGPMRGSGTSQRADETDETAFRDLLVTFGR